MKATWNTFRTYSAAGQRITAVLDKNGRAYFRDTDRHIEGSVDLSMVLDYVKTPADLQSAVMAAYDRSQYKTENSGTLAAIEDNPT